MIFTRFLPGVLKELIKHIPTVLFDTVEWSVLAHEFPKISKRYLQKEGLHELFDLQKAFLAPLKIRLDETTLKDRSTTSPHIGHEVLRLYFAQVQSPHGMFIDLSENHFTENTHSELVFHPNPLWTKFDINFQRGLVKIYDGFYLEDNELLKDGLIQCKLMDTNWDDYTKMEMIELFKKHFGASLTSEMVFKLDTFKDSFMTLADFLLSNKVKISVDFIYLGISLITMYSTLEKFNTSANVQKIYLDLKKDLKLL